MSVALIVGIIQGYLTLLTGIAYLIGFWEFAIFVFFVTKERLIRLRAKITTEVKELEGR